MIRAVIQKINPAGAPTVQTGYLSGMVLDSQTRQGIGHAKVTVIASNATVTTGANGHYLLSDVPTGSQAIQAEDDQGRSKLQKVDVRAGKVDICHVELS